MIKLTSGSAHFPLSCAARLTWGCSDTALLTTTLTWGIKPAAAAIVKLVDPWQCTTAFSVVAPVWASTVCTATGWS